MFKNKVSVDVSKCSLCQVCALTCSRGALQFEKGDSGVKIVLDSHLCKFPCEVCKEKCANQAIKIDKKLFFTYFPKRKEKWFVKYGVCKKCGRLIEALPDKEIICPNCLREQESLRQLRNKSALRARGNSLKASSNLKQH